MSARSSRQLAIAVVGIALALFLASSQFLGSYVQYLVGSLAVTFIVVQAVNLLAGLCGIWSLGHCAFVAIGAYATANLVAIGWAIRGGSLRNVRLKLNHFAYAR